MSGSEFATRITAAMGCIPLVMFQAGTPPADPRAPSTKKMAERLEELAAAADPADNIFLSVQRAALAERALKRDLGTRHEAAARLDLAIELIRASSDPAGIEQAIAHLDAFASLANQSLKLGPKQAKEQELLWRSVAWQRLGEIENCLAQHVCESCVFPIASGAVHALTRGSENARDLLMEMLKQGPDDLDARWRLNLIHMTLGTWPERVPAEHLLPAAAFASDGDIGKFKDVAGSCGVAAVGLSGGVVTEDLDGDGLLDIACSSYGMRDRMWLYRNDGDGGFTERAYQAGLEGEIGGNNLLHADYDNDGDVDLLVLRGGWYWEQGRIPNSLLRNRGDGSFEDVTVAAGIYSEHPTEAAVFADFDNDGWIDLFIGNESSQRAPPHPCELYLNDRDGTFTNVAAATGCDLVAFVKGVVAGDYDNDGRVDLYVSLRGRPNQLLRNESTPAAKSGEPPRPPASPGFRFRDVAKRAGVARPLMSVPCCFFDYDNDGWLDLYVATSTGFGKDRTEDIALLYLGQPTESERPCLFHNERDGTFREVAQATGADRAIFAMALNHGDLDNDGFEDLYLGTGAPDLRALLPNKMFRNDRGERFQDITTSGGFGHLQKGHGIAFADLDNDGDQDLYAVLGGAYSGDVYPNALFENPGHGARWITMRLRGTRANRSAIGARIHVRVSGPAGERSIHATVGTGGSFGSQSLQAEIGLGDATRIVFAEVRWPGSSAPQRFEELPLDRVIGIEEGRESIELVPTKPFKLGRPAPPRSEEQP